MKIMKDKEFKIRLKECKEQKNDHENMEYL